MKKLFLMMLPIMVFTLSAVFQSCRKDDNSRNKLEQSQKDALAAADAETEQKIKVFRQQCEFLVRNPGLKNSSLINSQDAVWLMEASLNYAYSFPRASSQNTRVDSCFLLIPKSDGDSVVFQDVALTYGKMVDSLYNLFNSTLWTEKQILLTDVSKKVSPDPDYILLKLTTAIGQLTEDLPPFGNPYNSTDYWFWGGFQGKCGPYYPCCFGSDASLEIAQYQQWFLPPYQLAPGQHVYYTDIEEVNIPGNTYINPNDLTPNDNLLDYLMFYQDPSLPNYHECLDPSEMWFYLIGLFKVVTDSDKASSLTSPPQKDFISLTLTSMILPLSIIEHKATIKYGVRHVSYDPEVPGTITMY